MTAIKPFVRHGAPIPALLAALATLSVCGTSSGDTWGPFTRLHRSVNGQHRLRVDWPDFKSRPRLTLEKKAGPGFAVVWKIESPQEHPPAAAFVADDGSAVVLHDQWGGLGSGKVLAFLGPNGKLGFSYSLHSILPDAEILHAQRSISSTYWAFPGGAFFRLKARQFVQLSAAGTTRAYRLPVGEPVRLTLDEECALWLELASEVRPRLRSKNVDTRAEAASLLGMLRDAASVSELTRLLDDPAKHNIGVSENPSLKSGSYEFFDVQSAAGRALSLIVGDDAVPLCQKKLRTANPMMRQTWMYLIVEAGGPLSRAALRSVSQGPAGPARDDAILALLQVNDADYARRHPELLSSKDYRLRSLAAATLSETAQAQDADGLEKRIWGKDETVALWSYRGLLRVAAKRAAELSPRLPTHITDYLAYEQRENLRVSKQAIAANTPLVRVAALRRHTHTDYWWGADEREANQLCRSLVIERPAGLETALRDASLAPCAEFRRITTAALAVLGDAKAEAALRIWCRSTEPYYRTDSLRWLELCTRRNNPPANIAK